MGINAEERGCVEKWWSSALGERAERKDTQAGNDIILRFYI